MEQKRIPVLLTDEQKESLSAAAKEVGLTISAYMRLAAIEKVNRDQWMIVSDKAGGKKETS